MTMPYLGDLKFGTRLLALAVDHANYRTVYFIEEYVSYCGQFQKILSLTAGATASTAQPKTHRNEAISSNVLHQGINHIKTTLAGYLTSLFRKLVFPQTLLLDL